ncbi:MAG: RNA-directed DNA polymerase [Salinivirgaceae bacterium]|jgi:RNA-directed DNA polymerase|nr:RNA-directed DNA polymerase [Salinivirgaceae bacterium]
MESFEHLLYQLHLSYLQARKNKRNTHNQLRFEMYQEEGLMQLAKAIYERKYNPKSCIAFIINKPVMREIFAADFTDRIVHHLLYRCIYPIIDRKLINDTYSCRVGKGTLYGINRVEKFIRSCSNNYSKETYILKLDIQAYFMNIQHQIIFDKVLAMLPEQKQIFLGISKETVLYLLRQTIFNPVKENCRIKGSRNDWNGLPPSKSLFYYPNNTGLPIGNLTSQVFGNVYMNDFDHFIKRELKIKYYGRYVDDMVFVHNDKSFLINIIPTIQNEFDKIGLKIHPNKIVLQTADIGIQFLGQIIKPYRNYVSSRTKNNFYQRIQQINKIMGVVSEFSWQQLCDIRTVLNSYLGILQHANTFNLRKAMLSKLNRRFYDFFFVSKKLDKVIINEDFWLWHFTSSYRFIN